VQSFTDPEVQEILRALKRRRAGGPSLLAYKDSHWALVRSADINAHIKEIAGAEFSAKDFRTWHATGFAAIALAESPPATSKAGRERAIVHATEQAAERLGNTPAVSRASYIDPRLIDRFRANATIARTLARIGRSDRSKPATRQKIERAVVALLDGVTRPRPRLAISNRPSGEQSRTSLPNALRHMQQRRGPRTGETTGPGSLSRGLFSMWSRGPPPWCAFLSSLEWIGRRSYFAETSWDGKSWFEANLEALYFCPGLGAGGATVCGCGAVIIGAAELFVRASSDVARRILLPQRCG
jgi:hypothetical protein